MNQETVDSIVLVMLHAPPELRASVGNQCLTAIRNGLQSLEPPYPYTREINNLIARAVEQRLDDIYKSTADVDGHA